VLNNKILYLLLLFLAGIQIGGRAQSDCSRDLKQAVEMYEMGLYQQAITLLSRGIENCDYVEQEWLTAYKTLISCYLEIDEIEEADKLLRRFLKENPIYKPFSTDPIPFANAIKQYAIRPKFSIYYNMGINLYFPEVQTNNSIWESADYSQPYTKTTGNVLVYGMKYYLTNSFSISTGLMYNTYHFSREILAFQYFNINYTETYNTFEVPLQVNYSFWSDKLFYPSVNAGVFVSRLAVAKSDAIISDKFVSTTGSQLNFEDAIKGIPMKDNRDLNNYGWYAGVALNCNVRRWVFSLSASYSADFNNYINAGSMYSTEELFYDYYYIDNTVKRSSLNFTFGINYNLIYKIKPKY